MTPLLSRRRLLQVLGVAAGAPLLGAIANQLLGTAWGQANERRVALFFVVGETMPMLTDHGFMPLGIGAGDNLDDKYPAESWAPVDQSGVTQPKMFAPLAARSDRLLFVDGLQHDLGSGSQHGLGFGVLSGATPLGAPAEYGGQPGGISIDQQAVKGIGQGTPLPSVHFGFVGSLDNHPDQVATTFASGANQSIPHIASPSLLAERLFGGGGAAVDPADLAAQQGKDTLYRTRLLDSMRHDIRRLQSTLAAEERARLDHYLSHIETFEAKQKGLQERMQAAGCNEAPLGRTESAEARLESMFQMAGLAVRCGLTNVVGVSIGHGYGHEDLQAFNPFFGPDGYHAHGSMEGYAEAVGRLYQLNSRLIAQFLDDIGVLADNALVLLTSGSGVAFSGHHHKLGRWPALIYDGTGELKTGSRYLRYAKNERSIVDLYSSVSHVLKAPDDAFNSSETNPARGPLLEIMAALGAPVSGRDPGVGQGSWRGRRPRAPRPAGRAGKAYPSQERRAAWLSTNRAGLC